MNAPDTDEFVPVSDPPAPPLLDLTLGIAFALGGAGLFAASTHFQIMVPGTPVGPGLMPRVCATIFMIGGAALSITAIRRMREDRATAEVETGTLGYSAVVLIGLLAVAWLAQYLGFAIAAFAYSLAVMRAGGARWPGAVLVAAITTALVYALFSNLMRVPLPRAEMIPRLAVLRAR